MNANAALTIGTDSGVEQSSDAHVASLHRHLFVRTPPLSPASGTDIDDRDWADFNIPAPYGQKVRNALNAEATSVRLSSLVGSDGSWYAFGKMIMDMCVLIPAGFLRPFDALLAG